MASSEETPETDDWHVSSYLLYLLAAVSERASSEFHAHVRTQGLRVPEWRVLACLADQDGAMITHLARIALMEQSRLTRIIDQMADRGLLLRRSDPQDGRRVRVFLTDAGREMAQKLIKDAKAHEADVLDGLSRTEAMTLKPILQALLKRLERQDGPSIAGPS